MQTPFWEKIIIGLKKLLRVYPKPPRVPEDKEEIKDPDETPPHPYGEPKIIDNETDEPIKEKVVVITSEKLYIANEKKNHADCIFFADSFNRILPKYEINTPRRVNHFFAQIIHESGNLKDRVENLNYSDSGLKSTFGKYYSTNGGEVVELSNPIRLITKRKASDDAHKPEQIANFVYSNRMSNGDVASGDGWRYRGRGLIQLTGKANYTEFSTFCKIDVVSNPDLVMNDADTMVECACWFWMSRNLNTHADNDDIVRITWSVNGGDTGLPHRRTIYAVAKSVFGDNEQ